MSNKVQVIFTAECEQGDACATLGFKVIPTTVSIQVNSDGLERGNNSPEQLFGKIYEGGSCYYASDTGTGLRRYAQKWFIRFQRGNDRNHYK
ncbi:hypothetical protein KGB86_004461 [Salmonella enterica]|nr:hypothetical protein [Salmonella enterica]EBN9793552.1 hypothetical protein [Salmonella enterica]EEI1617215.1 hypothetical protein [Salmonella enterica]EEO8956116.1 hypothetical protein [Salmonella enterica]EGL2362239.1 hypothetical protein [Salmonella enterica]